MKLELVVFHCFLEEDWMDMVLREILVIVYPIVIRHVCQTTDSKFQKFLNRTFETDPPLLGFARARVKLSNFKPL